MTSIWNLFQNTGFGLLVNLLALIAGLGVYKFVKEWLPW